MATYYNIYAVNGRTGKIIARTGAPAKDMAFHIAIGVAIGAHAFRKNAFVVVYEQGGDLSHSCNHSRSSCPIFNTEAEFLAAYNNR